MKAKYNPRRPFFYTAIGLGCLLHSLVWAQPQLTTQPKDRFLGPGASATFSVSPGGAGPFGYQWLFDGSGMAGATNRILSLGTPQPSQWGYYSVIVSNSSGSVTSQVAELKVFVTSPHTLSGIQGRANGSVDLTFGGETTPSLAPYYSLFPLETSSNLVDWAPLAMLQRANTALDPLHFVDDGAADSSLRFYRTPGSQLPTPAPQPTGPYAVGTFSVLVTNTLRPNARFMATFWYPAVAQAGVLPVKYMDRQVADSYYGSFAGPAAAFFSHALPNAPIATNLAPYPVLLYSPGYSGHRRENTDKTEELASWGYVVIGLDTRNTVVSVLPNGSVLSGRGQASSVAGYDADVEAHLQDAQALLDQLVTLNTDPRLGGRLDLQRIGMFGFSLGGATAAQLCLRDPRCKAGAGLDGAYFETNLLTQPLPVPWLFFRSDDSPDPAWPPGASPLIGGDDRVAVYNLQASNAYFVRLVSTVHVSFRAYDLFYDSPSFLTAFGVPMSGRALPPARLSEIVRAYLLSFFNKFLKGEDNHLLDGPAPAYPEVMQFLSKSSRSAEPEYPCAELVQGSDGNLYGTSQYGGTNAAGTVFRVTPEGALTTLVSFTGTNGSHPVAAVTQASDDNFYGTTEYGGANGNYGTVFQMTPAGTLTTLVSFNGTNGSYPAARLEQASDGSFYGTTAGGGAGGYGTVFRVTSTGALTTLVSFKNTDGAGPLAALVEGADGSFYGTTSRGGDLSVNSGGGFGTVFKITPAGVLTTLIRFNGDNGGGPAGALVLGRDANFYGTTAYGGDLSLNGGNGFGTVFKMTPAGALRRLVIFGGANGSYSIGPLVQGSDASFYGTTYGGGAGIGGTVFKMTSLAAQTTLVSFNGDNGYRLPAGLLQATDGSFYGITQSGGANGAGTVFQLSLAGTLKTLIAFGAHSNHR